MFITLDIPKKKKEQKVKTVPEIDRYSNPSFNSAYTESFFRAACPGCLGFKFNEITGHLKNDLCPKCKARMNKELAETFEAAQRRS